MSEKYVVYKIDPYNPGYLIRCYARSNRLDAIAEAAWDEEHGCGKFVVIKEMAN